MDWSRVETEAIILVIFMKEGVLPGVTVGTIQSCIYTLRNFRFGFMGHDEVMAEGDSAVVDGSSRLVVCNRSGVCRMEDKTDSNRAFSDLQMIKEGVKTGRGDRFVVVQRNNVVTASILGRDERANR